MPGHMPSQLSLTCATCRIGAQTRIGARALPPRAAPCRHDHDPEPDTRLDAGASRRAPSLSDRSAPASLTRRRVPVARRAPPPLVPRSPSSLVRLSEPASRRRSLPHRLSATVSRPTPRAAGNIAYTGASYGRGPIAMNARTKLEPTGPSPCAGPMIEPP